MFGIPLSFAALLTGVLLGLGTKWGVLRYPWVTTKLLLIVSVIAVGALVLSGGMNAMLIGRGGAEGQLIAGAAYDVVALTIATILGVLNQANDGLRTKKSGRPGATSNRAPAHSSVRH
jgi:hypothetical protein